jgi:hypothetical protein
VFFGTVGGKGDRAYHHASALHFGGYLGRWLLATGVLFALSAAVYLVRGRSRT